MQLDQHFGRGADQLEIVGVEIEHVRRWDSRFAARGTPGTDRSLVRAATAAARRTIWNASPARMCSLLVRTDASNSSRVMLDSGVAWSGVRWLPLRCGSGPPSASRMRVHRRTRTVVRGRGVAGGGECDDFHLAAHVVEDHQRPRNHEVEIGQAEARVLRPGKRFEVPRDFVREIADGARERSGDVVFEGGNAVDLVADEVQRIASVQELRGNVAVAVDGDPISVETENRRRGNADEGIPADLDASFHALEQEPRPLTTGQLRELEEGGDGGLQVGRHTLPQREDAAPTCRIFENIPRGLEHRASLLFQQRTPNKKPAIRWIAGS